MSTEQQIDHGAGRFPGVPGTGVLESEPLDQRRPDVAEDLPVVFSAAPMFRRAAVGYDRFQVDTYVRWAEDELAAAERGREHLVSRLLQTRAALDEARELATHSAAGGEFLSSSRRIGSMLAAAADEAESIRVEAEAHRSAARAQARLQLGHARWRIASAKARAEGMVADAAAEVSAMIAGADRVVDQAQRILDEARIEAAARRDEARAMEQRAVEQADLVRQQAAEATAAGRLQAREEILRMLVTGREERRRADAEATAAWERLDRDAAARRSVVLADVRALERRRADLLAELELLAVPTPRVSGSRLNASLRRALDRLRWRSRSLRAS